MITYQLLAGSTSQSVVIRIVDSTDGTPETAVVFNTAGIDIQYRREGAASVAITEVTLAALTTAWTSGGFLHIGNGYYRVDLPDAALATGATGVLVHGTVTGMVVFGCYIQLVAYNPFDAVRLGLTALPNAVAGANGGLPLGNASGQTTVATLTAGALAAINAELVDVWAVDTHAELGQMTPPASPTYDQIMRAIWKVLWNKLEQDKLPTGAQRLFNRAGTVVDQKTVLSDNGTTTTKDTWVSGP